MLLAIPAGLLSSEISRAGLLGLFWMVAAAAWAVTLYVRSTAPRMDHHGRRCADWPGDGLDGAAWLSASPESHCSCSDLSFTRAAQSTISGGIFAERVFQMSQQFTAQMGIQDHGQLLAQKNMMLSPEGHAGWVAFESPSGNCFLVLFAAAGGAMGARLLARSRRPQS